MSMTQRKDEFLLGAIEFCIGKQMNNCFLFLTNEMSQHLVTTNLLLELSHSQHFNMIDS